MKTDMIVCIKMEEWSVVLSNGSLYFTTPNTDKMTPTYVSTVEQCVAEYKTTIDNLVSWIDTGDGTHYVFYFNENWYVYVDGECWSPKDLEMLYREDADYVFHCFYKFDPKISEKVDINHLLNKMKNYVVYLEDIISEYQANKRTGIFTSANGRFICFSFSEFTYMIDCMGNELYHKDEHININDGFTAQITNRGKNRLICDKREFESIYDWDIHDSIEKHKNGATPETIKDLETMENYMKYGF